MTDLIPFHIEAQRVIHLLAKQIYQSPLALLRENTQNAFDAIRQRSQHDHSFAPEIEITLATDRIVVSDNGIGMTGDDLRKHYWTAGSSSKNNEAARAAGVVGTFGIGAMANFGIAETLVVETESAVTTERTVCRAEKSKLSLKDDCIELDSVESKGFPGTTITAHVSPEELINVDQARRYIIEFVALLDIPVYVNGELVSQKSIDNAVAKVAEVWRHEASAQPIGQRLRADVLLVMSSNADIWLRLSNVAWDDRPLSGRLVLRTGQSTLRTFRSGFGLATATVSSYYGFGGVADLLILEPTAGREALTVESLQLLQSMVTELDRFTSELLAGRDECDSSTPFMSWVVAHNAYELCGRLKIAVTPGDRLQLRDVAARSALKPMLLYAETDPGVIKAHASEDTPLLMLSRTNPRRKCEEHYLKKNAKVTAVSNAPTVMNRRTAINFTLPESVFAFRIQAILDSDYFLKAEVDFGDISHGLPILVETQRDGVRVTLNPASQSIRIILGLYDKEFGAFGSLVKDFVRTVVFPRVADYVPSSTRQGAEAFLKAIRSPRELFEYADDDLGDLPRIWEDYNENLISLEQAVERSKTAVRHSIQFVETAIRARDVLPDVIENEQVLQLSSPDTVLNLDAAPAITRLDTKATAKLLTIDDGEAALRGYRCFLAITDKARDELGEFFLQPHRTSIVWGGQRTLFIFQHHSGRFGLYYDLQTREPVESPAGGGPYPTATIVLKDRVFIPIPDEIRASFIPKAGERKRFEIRADILRTEVESEKAGTG